MVVIPINADAIKGIGTSVDSLWPLDGATSGGGGGGGSCGCNCAYA